MSKTKHKAIAIFMALMIATIFLFINISALLVVSADETSFHAEEKTIYDVSKDFPGVSDGADVNSTISGVGPSEWYYQALNVPAFYQYGMDGQDSDTGALTTDTSNTTLQLYPQMTHGGASPQEIEMKDGSGTRSLPKLIQYPNGNGIADTPDQIGTGGFTASVQYSGIYGGQWVHPGQGLAMVYTFKVPRAGSIYLRDSIYKPAGGDGVQLAVLHQPAASANLGYEKWGDSPSRSLYGAVPVYPQPKVAMQADGTGWQQIAAGETFEFICDNFDVEEGDMIHFILDGKSDISNDKTFFAPCVVYDQVPDRLSLDETEAILKAGIPGSIEGDTLLLNATILPVASANKEIEWSSSAENVATVSGEGLVTAVSIGEAVITAKLVDGVGLGGGEVTASCTITVVSPEDTITLNEKNISLEQAYSKQLTYTILPPESADNEVEWSIDGSTPDEPGKEVISLSDEGVVTALNPGSATICVKIVGGSTSDTAKITVTKAGKPQLSLDKTVVNVVVGDQDYISTSIQPLYHKNDIVQVFVKDSMVAFATWSEGKISIEGKMQGTTQLEAKVEGGNTVMIEVNVLAKAEKIYTWRNEFRSEQGPEWFYYMQDPGSEDYKEMEYVPSWWGAYEDDINVQKQAGAFRPKVSDQVAETPGEPELAHNQYLTIWQGHFIHPGKDYNAVLGFKAPMTGTVDLLSYFRLYSSGSVNVKIMHENEQIWPSKEWQTVDSNNVAVIGLQNIEVTRGDMFYIIVNSNGENSFDSTYLNPQFHYTQYEAIPDTLILNHSGELKLAVGEQKLLTVKIEPSESKAKELTWTSSDTSVATVDRFGVVTGLKEGEVVVNASLEGGAIVSLNVRVTQLDIDPLEPGEEGGLKPWQVVCIVAGGVVAATGIGVGIGFMIKKFKKE